MHRPLAFHEQTRKVVKRTEKTAKGPAKFVGLRQVNVVAHVATKQGRPSRWDGFAARQTRPTDALLSVPMQSRSAVVVEGKRPCTMLVFNEKDDQTGAYRPASTIVAGASSVPSAIEAVLMQPCRHPSEIVAVFNTVVTGRIEAEGLTLETLRRHPQSIVTKKFPGAVCAPSMRIIRPQSVLTIGAPGVSLNLLSSKESESALAITVFVNQHSGAASFIAPGVLSAADLERALTEIRNVVNDCCKDAVAEC